jgi:drug/metabolite transporter (DMT)-like permease
MPYAFDTPPALALLAAFIFAASAHVQSFALKTCEPTNGTLITIASTTAFYWFLAPFFVSPAFWMTAAAALFALIGIFRPALTLSLAARGIKHLGPTLNTGLTATGPIFAVCFAVLILNEQLSWQIAFGTLAVVTGAVFAYNQHSSNVGYGPHWAIAFPLATAVLRAAAHPLTKLGYRELAEPFFAGLVSNTVSLFVFCTVLLVRGKRPNLRNKQYAWFVLAGLLNAIAVYLVNEALRVGKVITVAPITACTPVFAMFLGWLVFRNELITWRTVATVFLVVPGVLMVIFFS